MEFKYNVLDVKGAHFSVTSNLSLLPWVIQIISFLIPMKNRFLLLQSTE